MMQRRVGGLATGRRLAAAFLTENEGEE